MPDDRLGLTGRVIAVLHNQETGEKKVIEGHNIASIDECAIVDNRTTPTAALCHAEFSPSFTKTSADTLKIFVNHTFNGT